MASKNGGERSFIHWCWNFIHHAHTLATGYTVVFPTTFFYRVYVIVYMKPSLYIHVFRVCTCLCVCVAFESAVDMCESGIIVRCVSTENTGATWQTKPRRTLWSGSTSHINRFSLHGRSRGDDYYMSPLGKKQFTEWDVGHPRSGSRAQLKMFPPVIKGHRRHVSSL